MPKKDINIFWFRQDLRLLDNPGLYNSIKNGTTLPIFIFDDENAKDHINGSASKWWLHHSLIALKQSCLLYTSPSPRDKRQSRMPSSA